MRASEIGPRKTNAGDAQGVAFGTSLSTSLSQQRGCRHFQANRSSLLLPHRTVSYKRFRAVKIVALQTSMIIANSYHVRAMCSSMRESFSFR